MKPVYYIGIMSGTSLDGIDAILADLRTPSLSLVRTFFLSYDASLRQQLLDLHQPGYDELNRAALLSNELSHLYSQAVSRLLKDSGITSQHVVAIGCHGQTVRHCPGFDKNYTIQLVNAALLAELTDMTVVVDFRSRDMAAGGQGAPLVPAFHQAVFMSPNCHRIIVNIGGISNITSLESGKAVFGFDCGPGNLLMDAWCLRHIGKAYDKNGEWAASGKVIPSLLAQLLATQFLTLPPPKSTGRELFNIDWLECYLLGSEVPEDVQATLLELTVISITQSIYDYCSTSEEVYVCGGGAQNSFLMIRLKQALPRKMVALTDKLGIEADWVEAYAFAWLAQQTVSGAPGNLPAVTGAKGERILGAIYRT